MIWRFGDLAFTRNGSSPDVSFQEVVIYFLFLVDVAYEILSHSGGNTRWFTTLPKDVARSMYNKNKMLSYPMI